MTNQVSQVGWVALCLVPRIGGRTLGALLSAFGSPRAVFEASEQDLLSVARIGPKTVAAIRDMDLGLVARQVEDWQSRNIHLLGWQDADYPTPFLSLPDRPPLLFARGQPRQDWSRTVAIVGTREPEARFELIAERMGHELARRGWLVVSGLARGIDAAAHRGALGRTVAVLGCGVDEVHPARNRPLGARILKEGAIFAEVPPGTMPSPGALMARNRLIAGLADAVIVVQAGRGSGSLEAARRARLTGRTVLTLDIPEYEGNQLLLQMEAVPLPAAISDWDWLADTLLTLPAPPRQLSFFDEEEDSP